MVYLRIMANIDDLRRRCPQGHLYFFTGKGCRQCKRIANKRWREANRDRFREMQRDWRNANREKHRETQKRWRTENRDRVRAHRDQHKQAARDAISAWPRERGALILREHEKVRAGGPFLTKIDFDGHFRAWLDTLDEVSRRVQMEIADRRASKQSVSIPVVRGIIREIEAGI